MAGNHDSPVFSYQTRVAVTAEQDSLLREYARLFGHVERTLFADLQRGKDAGQLKSEYLARFSITARQFNALAHPTARQNQRYPGTDSPTH